MTREERILAAKGIIKADPNISKRRLQHQLRQDFGIGLADTTRRRLLGEANTVPVLLRRASAPCFSRHEARILRKAVRQSGKAPYVVETVNDLYAFAKNLHDQEWTNREIRHALLDKLEPYIATKTTRTAKNRDGTKKGQIDIWAMLRDARDRAIAAGDYTPKQKKRAKGDVAAQKARWKDKQATKAHSSWVERESRQIQSWLKQKDRAIAVATTPERKRELQAQRDNLARTLEAIK